MALSIKLTFSQMLSTWAAQLNPLLANPINNAQILQNVQLINGVTVVNHKLGRTMQGYWIVDQPAAASIIRTAPFNASTLTLTSNAALNINLAVF